MNTIFSESSLNIFKIKAQRGYTNIQLAIGMVVSILVMLGSLGGYQYVQQTRVTNEIAQISDLKLATQRYGQAIGAGTVFTTANTATTVLQAANFFPSGNNKNQWGGTITGANATTAITDDSIAFTFGNVPQFACREIALKLDNVASHITINSVVTKALGAASDVTLVNDNCLSQAAGTTMIYRLQR